jgi:membrane protease YdiL (CAAX protease family)
MEETRRLEDRYGWYGRLATSQVGADSAVVRPAVEAAAKRTAGTFFAVFGLCVPALIAGLVLFILFTAKWSNGTMRPRYAWGDPTDADALLEAFAVYLCAMAALTLGSRFLPDRATLAWNGLLVAPIAMALAWGWMRGLTGRRLAKAVGWNPGRGIAREMFAGIVGYVAGIPLIAAAIVVCLFLAKFSGTPASHPIEFEIENGGWDRVLLYLLACVFAPVVEELMFRGMLLRHLTARLSWFVSAIIVSVIFASVHPQGWTAIPVLAAIGMVLAMVRVQRDTLVASMTAHALNNFLFITLLVIAVG